MKYFDWFDWFLVLLCVLFVATMVAGFQHDKTAPPADAVCFQGYEFAKARGASRVMTQVLDSEGHGIPCTE